MFTHKKTIFLTSLFIILNYSSSLYGSASGNDSGDSMPELVSSEPELVLPEPELVSPEQNYKKNISDLLMGQHRTIEDQKKAIEKLNKKIKRRDKKIERKIKEIEELQQLLFASENAASKCPVPSQKPSPRSERYVHPYGPGYPSFQ